MLPTATQKWCVEACVTVTCILCRPKCVLSSKANPRFSSKTSGSTLRPRLKHACKRFDTYHLLWFASAGIKCNYGAAQAACTNTLCLKKSRGTLTSQGAQAHYPRAAAPSHLMSLLSTQLRPRMALAEAVHERCRSCSSYILWISNMDVARAF